MKANIWNMFEGLKDFVEDGLPDALREVEVEMTDGVLLPDPKQHVLGYKDLFSADAYPLVCYIASEGPVEAAAMHGQWLNPQAVILVSLVHNKPDVLEKILLRYSDAFVNLLSSDESLGGVCDTSQLESIDWGHAGGEDKTHAILSLSLRMTKEVLD
jgi:hypothetical protein